MVGKLTSVFYTLKIAYVVQLIAGIVGGLIIYMISYVNPSAMFGFLIAILPFEFVNSRYGSATIGMIFAATLAAIASRKLDFSKLGANVFPIIGLGLVAMAYILSFVNELRPLLIFKATYLIGLLSNLAIFLYAYGSISTEKDLHRFFKLLLIMNFLVLGYCALMLAAGFTQIIPFGIQEFAFAQNRLNLNIDERRLMGPFAGAGILAEYFVIMIFMHVYYLLSTGKRKKIILTAIFGNLCFMVATGNRGAPIAMVMGFIIFIFLFRDRLNLQRSLKIIVIATVLITVASVLIVKYTQFNVLYERLLSTEIQGMTPDTRSAWPLYIGEGFEKPVLGHGVRMILPSDVYDENGNRRTGIPLSKVRSYPHSLYIYVFYTLGFVGILAYLVLCCGLFFNFMEMNHGRSGNLFVNGMPRLAILILMVFCIDQFKIEFLRHNYIDYQNVISAIFGMFMASRKVMYNTVSIDN